MTCSQIWLSALVDGRQPTYLTKIEKKNPWLGVCKTNLHFLNKTKAVENLKKYEN
jgi:hypothetical protein